MIKNEIERKKDKLIELYNNFVYGGQYRKGHFIKLAAFFNIPIEQSREKAYRLIKIDLEKLSIIIYDTERLMVYNASYKRRLIGTNLEDEPSLCVITEDNFSKRIVYYSLDDNKPIYSKIIMTHNDYEIAIEKEKKDSDSKDSRAMQTTVNYSKKVMINNKRYNQILLTKVLKHMLFTDGRKAVFRQLSTYSPNCLIEQNDHQDRYTYLFKNNNDINVVYGINRINDKDNINDLSCICIEKVDLFTIKNCIPSRIPLSSSEELLNGTLISAMIFKGKSINNDIETDYELKIYKNSSCIELYYNEIEGVNIAPVLAISIPLQSTTSIQITEIECIIEKIKDIIFNPSIQRIICHELESFADKLKNKNKSSSKEDILSPEVLEKIPYAKVTSEIREYFKTFSEQFNAATNFFNLNEFDISNKNTFPKN